MPQLRIDLQEVFLDDLIVVRINDAEVCRGKFRTRLQIGLAHSIERKVPEGKVEYCIELPDKNLSLEGDVEMSGDKFLGVTLSEDGQLNARVSSEPFRYL